MSSEILVLEGVTKTYDSGLAKPLTVLDGVDLNLKTGEVVALVAPSGAGKSTLLHVAGLLDVPSSGKVEVCGEDVSKMNDKARTRMRRDQIGFVYQFHHLLPEFSALENVMMPQRASGIGVPTAKQRAAELLGMVGLSERHDHRPAELSGGEQQRVAICRALANVPSLILADEPTGNLDPETADNLFDVLVSIARQTGLTALVATHNMELAARMDRIVRLEAGRIVTK